MAMHSMYTVFFDAPYIYVAGSSSDSTNLSLKGLVSTYS